MEADLDNKKKEAIVLAKLVIKSSKKYVFWLDKHLQKEHPKTKGKTIVRGVK